MSNNSTTSNLNANINTTLANDLNRIRSYATVMAKMSSSGDNHIRMSDLEQIFSDIANVTDEAAARLYKLGE